MGRFSINFAVMILSRFRIEPREGHLELNKHVYGYLHKFPDAKICFHIGILPNEEEFSKGETWGLRLRPTNS